MVSNKVKYHAREGSLGEAEENFMAGRGGPQGVGNVLQGSGISSTIFWLRDLGTFGGNGEEGRWHTRYF